MNLIEQLNEYIDEEDALKRFMGNRSLYEKMLKKFPPAIEKLEVLEYMKSGDYKTALENAHAIKGVAGNLSITAIYKAYSEVVRLLRENQNEKAYQIAEEVIPIQNTIVKCIENSI